MKTWVLKPQNKGQDRCGRHIGIYFTIPENNRKNKKEEKENELRTIKNFLSAKDIVIRQIIDWDKIETKHISEKIDKECSSPNNQKKKKNLKKCTKV